MKKLFFSLLLLVTAAFMSGVLAQSAEEAAKYGQLQEIQLPTAGKLGKFIKKEDPNVKALKISGELNEKDWMLLYSLPNLAYLDLLDVHNIATFYRHKDPSGYKTEYVIKENELLLYCTNTLKYLVIPHGVSAVSLPEEIKYSLDMLVSDNNIKWISHRNNYTEQLGNTRGSNNIEIYAWKILPSNFGYPIEGYLSDLSHFSYSRAHCKTLYIEGGNQTFNCGNIFPEEIVFSSTGERILNRYLDNSKIVDLSKYDRILGHAFDGSTVESVNIGERITEIPISCFSGCKKLKKVIMPNVKTIKSGAFYECENLEYIDAPAIESVERYAFLAANIPSNFQYTYKLPTDVEKIDLAMFDNTGVTTIDLTEFQYAPDIDETTWNSRDGRKYESLENLKYNTLFLIPQGARSHRYNVGLWADFRIKEVGAKSIYECHLDSVGSLANYITDDIAQNVESLTINGVMDETEFNVIKKCRNLKYLDLSHCFTFASVAVAKSEILINLALAHLYAMASSWDRQRKELQYANHEITTKEMQEAQVRDYIIQTIQDAGIKDISVEDVDAILGQDKVIPSSECYFPKYALDGLFELEEIKFPKKLLKIEDDALWAHSKYYKTKKVTLSNELKYLGKHIFYEQVYLTEINFPDSLEYIGIGCFEGTSLKKVDLSNTKIKYWGHSAPVDATNMLYTDAFLNTPIVEFHSPKGVQHPKKWMENYQIFNSSEGLVIYMNTPEPFCKSENFGSYKEIHIPHGMKAAWRGYPNVIDDIDL